MENRDLGRVKDSELILKIENRENMPEIDVYVDGSYSKELRTGGCGIYMVDRLKNKVVHKEYTPITSEKIQIKGKSSLATELNAALIAIELALSMGLKSVNIVYDCDAILDSIWGTKMKNYEMYKFKAIVADYLKRIHVTFIPAMFYNYEIHNNAHKLSRMYLAS